MDLKTLKIDLDGKYRLRQLYFGLKKLKEVWKIKGIEVRNIRVYETTKGFHIYLELNKKLSIEELVLYQCLLGSDLRRETHNLFNYYFNRKRFNYFCRKKIIYKNGEVVYQSEERVTKKAKKLLRRLVKILWGWENGYE